MLFDLVTIFNLLPRTYSRDDIKLLSLMACAVKAIKYCDEELGRGENLSLLTDRNKVDGFRILSNEVLEILEELRQKTESSLIEYWYENHA